MNAFISNRYYCFAGDLHGLHTHTVKSQFTLRNELKYLHLMNRFVNRTQFAIELNTHDYTVDAFIIKHTQSVNSYIRVVYSRSMRVICVYTINVFDEPTLVNVIVYMRNSRVCCCYNQSPIQSGSIPTSQAWLQLLLTRGCNGGRQQSSPHKGRSPSLCLATSAKRACSAAGSRHFLRTTEQIKSQRLVSQSIKRKARTILAIHVHHNYMLTVLS